MQIAIALVQFNVAPSNPELNLTRMESFIRQASKQGAQLVVFPEDAVTGPLDGQTAYVAQAAAFLAACQAFAVQYEVDLVPGTWTVQEGTALYNTAHYINKDGTIAGVYRKINLWQTEQQILTAGQTVSVFPTAYGLTGMIICWDISFPRLSTGSTRNAEREQDVLTDATPSKTFLDLIPP